MNRRYKILRDSCVIGSITCDGQPKSLTYDFVEDHPGRDRISHLKEAILLFGRLNRWISDATGESKKAHRGSLIAERKMVRYVISLIESDIRQTPRDIDLAKVDTLIAGFKNLLLLSKDST